MSLNLVVDTLLSLEALGYDGRIYDAYSDGLISMNEIDIIEPYVSEIDLLKSCCSDFSKPLPGERRQEKRSI